MNQLKDAARLALDALKDTDAEGRVDPCYAADYLTAALALPDAEPVAWIDQKALEIAKGVVLGLEFCRPEQRVTAVQVAVIDAMKLMRSNPAASVQAWREYSTEPSATLLALTNALLHQIDIGDFVDSNGRAAKMLKPVHDLMRFLSTPQPAIAPQPVRLTDAQINAVTINFFGEMKGLPLDLHRAYARLIIGAALNAQQGGKS